MYPIAKYLLLVANFENFSAHVAGSFLKNLIGKKRAIPERLKSKWTKAIDKAKGLESVAKDAKMAVHVVPIFAPSAMG